MTTTSVVGLLLIGGAGGFWLGIRYAENSRARWDMNKTWQSRTKYREGDGK